MTDEPYKNPATFGDMLKEGDLLVWRSSKPVSFEDGDGEENRLMVVCGYLISKYNPRFRDGRYINAQLVFTNHPGVSKKPWYRRSAVWDNCDNSFEIIKKPKAE